MRTKYPEDFQEAWKAWPGRWREEGTIRKVGKAEAYDIWLSMDAEDREDAKSVIVSGKVKRAGTQFLKDFHRWLKLRRWEDFI